MSSTQLVSVRFDALNLDDSAPDPRYGVEVYFNGVLVQPQIVVRPAQLGVAYTTPQFSAASVNIANPGWGLLALAGLVTIIASSKPGAEYVRPSLALCQGGRKSS